MLLVLSHALAFATLFVASIFDLDTTDVPDVFAVTGVVGGIVLHGLYSYSTGALQPSLLFSAPFEALGPLGWSLGVGIAFSLYGWGAYFRGMWGGADAFAMSVLGFAAPYTLPSASLLDPINLFVNIMLVGFFYILGASVYRSWRHGNVYEPVKKKIYEQRRRIGIEFGAAVVFSYMIAEMGLNGMFYFVLLTVMIFLYRFLQVVQDDLMYETIPVSKLEGGEVPAPGQGFGKKIEGLTEEDIESIDKEEIRVRYGVAFMPVFPLALLVTDVFGGGLTLLIALL